MAESYVPQDTMAICTMMTNGAPQMIKTTTPSNVMYSTKKQPFLTMSDNKLGGSFACKKPAKLWGGLQTLALGIALGAAIVLTGGAAAVVIIAACAVSVVAGGVALFKMAHDCDATLSIKWSESHKKVRFNQDFALLNRSFLDCPQKGKITIIMDPVIAQKAADFITNNNTKEYLWQAGSQFVMGFIGGVTAGTSAVAVGVSAIISGVMYFPSEWLGDTDWGGENVATASTASAMATDGVTATTGAGLSAAGVTTEVGGTIINKNVGNAVGGAVQHAAGEATGNVSQSLTGALRNYIGHSGLKADKYQGYKGIAGFIANIAIGTYADKKENKLADETKRVAEDFNESDKSNGINVIALDV
ncbi:DUF4280 domain-containing protein [Empedobacter falsenii]|uniref:hypothetical protein n=1 Tax=Empedobacter falsenii TaxID=343874 RepID=UPI00257538A6|nr:hypothetical protein [Empedobacter falsenii]MDM1548844.1 DUF4280 domain-containing protein [Empedobacter falsenii]